MNDVDDIVYWQKGPQSKKVNHEELGYFYSLPVCLPVWHMASLQRLVIIIMSVLGKQSNEMSAVHLVKTYCLSTLMYGCEAWTLTDGSLHKLNTVWNNCFWRIFSCCWRESTRPLQFYCKSLLDHTHTHLTALCPGLPRWAGTRKVKPIWILLK